MVRDGKKGDVTKMNEMPFPRSIRLIVPFLVFSVLKMLFYFTEIAMVSTPTSLLKGR